MGSGISDGQFLLCLCALWCLLLGPRLLWVSEGGHARRAPCQALLPPSQPSGGVPVASTSPVWLWLHLSSAPSRTSWARAPVWEPHCPGACGEGPAGVTDAALRRGDQSGRGRPCEPTLCPSPDASPWGWGEQCPCFAINENERGFLEKPVEDLFFQFINNIITT